MAESLPSLENKLKEEAPGSSVAFGNGDDVKAGSSSTSTVSPLNEEVTENKNCQSIIKPFEIMIAMSFSVYSFKRGREPIIQRAEI